MRKLILQEFVTIDGFAADPKGGMDFQQKYVAKDDKSFQKDAMRFLNSVDTMLLGRTTYEMFAGYWPKADEEVGEFAEKINSLSKYVVSSSLKNAPWGRWEPATVIHNNVSTEVTKLKQAKGKDIVIWGSMTLAQPLMKEGLIDEIQLRVIPATLGSGKPVFADELDMELIETKTYDKGMVLLRYNA